MRWWFRRAPLAAAVIAAVLLAGCGAGSSPQSSSVTPSSASATGQRPTATPSSPRASATPTPAPRPAGPVVLPVAPGAGDLPQDRVFPSTHSTAFRNAMTDLWLAVITGNPHLALPAFFPVGAYRQVKAIPYPTADWQDRLWFDFSLDVGAAHHLIDDRDARLVQVIVPADDADWVYPGDCYNTDGYWHVGGARVVYTERGQERSLGIASLISWRGVWYVIHFGAVLRSVVTGIVDQPTVGPGIPGPAGGC
jgi:hypothetical protein